MKFVIDITSTQDQLKGHGIGVYTRNIVRRLIEFGNGTDRFYLLRLDAPSTLDAELEELAPKKKVEQYIVGKLKSGTLSNRYFYGSGIVPAVKQILKERDAELARGLSSNKTDIVYYAPYFWRGAPVKLLPTVMTMHDFALPRYDAYSEISWWHNILRRFDYWQAMKAFNDAKAILTPSHFVKEEFKKFMPRVDQRKIYPIYLGIELKKKKRTEKVLLGRPFLPRDIYDRGYFIYMGGTPYSNKNSKAVIDSYVKFALSIRRKELPYLVVAGRAFTASNRNAQNFRNYAEKAGGKNIIFLGEYGEDETYSLLKRAFAQIHLSLYEGFGLAVAEALAAGTPVIANRGSSYLELVGDGGILVDANDTTAVAKEMYRVFSDKKLVKVLKERAVQQAGRFSWDGAAIKTLDILRRARL